MTKLMDEIALTAEGMSRTGTHDEIGHLVGPTVTAGHVDEPVSQCARDGQPTMTGTTSRGVSVITQYGVQTATSSTVLIVTTDRAAAQDALGWISDGQIVARTLAISAWHPSIDVGDADTTHFGRTG